MKKDFIPGKNSDLNSFAKTFLERLEKQSAGLSLNAAEVERAKNSLKSFGRSYSKMISLKAESKAANENFYSEKKKTIDVIRKISAQIKSSRSYNSAIGKGFNIIYGHKPVTDFSNHKPVLKVTVNAKIVTIKFIKNKTDGIKLYSKRLGEKKFTEIGIILIGAFTDKRPKLTGVFPESRDYYAEYFVKNNVVGKRSNVVRVVIP